MNTYILNDKCTIFVGNYARQYTGDELKTYLSKYGEIISVEERRCVKRLRKSYAFVTFKEGVSAWRARFEDSQRMKIKYADNWNQRYTPDSEFILKETTKQTSILDLNDDCMLHIFSFLNPNARMKLAFACRKYHLIFPKDIDIVQALSRFTTMDRMEILKNIGENIVALRFDVCRIDKIFTKFCPNVRRIKMDSRNMSEPILNSLPKGFKDLTCLKLVNCRIKDNICSSLDYFVNLEELDLSSNERITGKHLYKVSKLKMLNLKYCYNLESKYFIQICRNLNLRKLNVFKCHRLDYFAIINMSYFQKELQDLCISTKLSYNYLKSIKRLPKLKYLKIFYDHGAYNIFDIPLISVRHLELCNATLTDYSKEILYNMAKLHLLNVISTKEVDDNFLSTLATKVPIKYLSCKDCKSLSNNGILEVLKNSTSIREIDISCCVQFKEDLLFDIVNKISERETQIKLITKITSVDGKLTEDLRLCPVNVENTSKGKIRKYEFPFAAWRSRRTGARGTWIF